MEAAQLEMVCYFFTQASNYLALINNTVSSILFQFVFIDSKENCHFQKEYPMNHQFIFEQQ